MEKLFPHNLSMPRVATFACFALYMYANDHAPPHVHIESATSRASLSLADGRLLKGNASATAIRETRAWI